MTLYDKIMAIYPDLNFQDFGQFGTIKLQNDADSNGDYIREWNNPDHPRPTEAQLEAVNDNAN